MYKIWLDGSDRPANEVKFDEMIVAIFRHRDYIFIVDSFGRIFNENGAFFRILPTHIAPDFSDQIIFVSYDKRNEL